MASAVILKDLIKDLALTIAKFEREIGVSNGAVWTLIKRNANISPNIIARILERYPMVNKEWLHTGEGEMKKEKPELDSDLTMIILKQQIQISELRKEIEKIKEFIAIIMANA